MRTLKALTVVCLPLIALAPAAFAGEGAPSHIVHFGVLFSHPLGDPEILLAGDRERVDIDDDNLGFYVDYETKLSTIVGLKFGFMVNDHDMEVESGPERGMLGRLRARTYTVNLLFHPGGGDGVDFYFGGGVAYVNHDDIAVRRPFESMIGDNRLRVDSDRTWNAAVGLDIPLGGGELWGLNLDARFVKTTVDTDRKDDLVVDPVSLGAALSVRW